MRTEYASGSNDRAHDGRDYTFSAEALARALDPKAKRVGPNWRCRCPVPAHDDHKPSLDIKDSDGKLLFICRAGCSKEDIISELRRRELWPSAGGSYAAPKPARKPAPTPEWVPMVPPPDDALPPRPHQLKADTLFTYQTADGRAAFYVRRFEAKADRNEVFLPVCYGTLDGATGWHDRAPLAPIPLYNLHELAKRPDAPVMVCEGEKAADSAGRLFPEYVAISSMSGSNRTAIGNTDWSPLIVRNVTTWPDADAAGEKAAREIERHVTIAAVVNTEGLPPTFDAANLEVLVRSEGVDPAAWLKDRLRPAERPEVKLPPPQDLIESYFDISDEPWNPDELPDRPWLAMPYLMRAELTLPHGPGGHGKSQLSIAWAIALALGFPFGRLRPKGRSRVILTNFEDSKEEMRRRISAALQYFPGKTEADLKGWLFRVSLGKKGEATMFELDDFGQVRTNECWDVLQAVCERLKPDAIFADPLVAINGVPESNNTLMRRVMVHMKKLATVTNAAVVLIHHDNKSGNSSDDQDNARGAGDIVNAVRFELAVKKMSAAEAEQFGVLAEKRGFYFRVGSPSSKMNYSAPDDAEWFERIPVPIGACPDVVRCLPWEPLRSRVSDEQTDTIVAEIEKGTPTGPYARQLYNTSRNLSVFLTTLGIVARGQQNRVLGDLIASGRIVQAHWVVPGKGAKKATGLRSAAGLPHNWRWQD